jgi:hypothetical protein
MGAPCQDAYSKTCISRGESGWLIACVADGAGSASHSVYGARAACDALVAAATRYLQAGNDPSQDGCQAITAWFGEAERAVGKAAELHDVSAPQCATTLLAAIVGERVAVFGQIGDGAIVAASSADQVGTFDLIVTPHRGEYANETLFITSGSWRDHFTPCVVPEAIADLVMLTDGMETLAMDFARNRPHPPFHRFLLQPLWDNTAVDAIAATECALAEFLASDWVNQRSEDDKTMIVATRRSLSNAGGRDR